MVVLHKKDANTATYLLDSVDDTLVLGKAVAQVLFPGLALLLEGDLGVGKTTLVRAICKALDWNRTCSPSFSIVNEYSHAKIPVAHADLYRLTKADGRDFGFDDYLDDGWVLIVEWPDRLICTDWAQLWRCRIDRDADKRVFSVKAEGDKAFQSLKRLTYFLP